HLFPEIVFYVPAAACRPPMRVGKLIGEQGRRVDDCECVFGFAVNEFRTELDGQRKIGSVDRPDASADAVAAFENADFLARAGKIARGGETGDAGTDDDDVEPVSH